jgi:hypothetical protein
MKKSFVFKTVVTALVLATLSACQQQDPECFLNNPEITVDGSQVRQGEVTIEVFAGENFQITTPVFDGASYSWTGPNNFQSNVSNPIISDVSSATEGVYKLTRQIGICKSETEFTVNLDLVEIPCTLVNNRLTYANPLFTSGNYVYIDTSVNSTFGTYEIAAFSSSGVGTLEFFFRGTDVPEEGIYDIEQNCSNPDNTNSICIRLFRFGYYYSARGGQAFVSKLDNGKLVISFCDVNFGTVSGIENVLISTQVTQP